MSGVGQSEDGVEASTSGMMETTMMEGEEYYNPDDTGTWAQKEMSDQLCRICAKPNQYLIPIFEGEGIEHQLEPKIQKHLPIEVSESDDLPLQVCYQCASTLIAWNDLVIACIEADKKLRQMHEQEEEDEDDKGAEFFDEPILDSDEGEEPVQPSTSIATVASDMQSDATSQPKRSPGKAKKPKLKMTLVKSPTAGPSGLKIPLKRVASKPKEDAGQEVTERLQPSSQPTLKEFHITYQAYIQNSMSCKEAMTETAEVTWIKTEDFDSQKTAFCHYCQASFPGTGDLATHLVHTHSEHVYHCDKCDQVINSKFLFVEHTKLHENNLTEETVDFAEGSKHSEDASSDEYLPPKARSSKEPPSKSRNISCEICLKKFKRDYHLKKHRATHKAESNAIIVDEDTESRGVAVDVEEDKSTRPKEVYRCELCSKNFKLKDSYKSHLRIHTGEKPFTCHICGKSFSHTGGLYYHLKHVHAGIKNHACDLCGRSFALKAAMEDHRRIHTGERPYVCHTCGKSFKTKASLYIHSKIHTDSFPHPCTYCDRRFRWRQQLLAHLTTHTGEKTHLCPVCGKGFGVKNDLTRHKLIHSDAKPFACSICGLSFGQKRYLKNHEKSRHGIRR